MNKFKKEKDVEEYIFRI